jgi:hypothetical protein
VHPQHGLAVATEDVHVAGWQAQRFALSHVHGPVRLLTRDAAVYRSIAPFASVRLLCGHGLSARQARTPAKQPALRLRPGVARCNQAGTAS